MSKRVVVEYGEGPMTAEVSTVAELDELFDTITDQAKADGFPAGVVLYLDDEGPDGPGLMLGLGREWSVLMDGPLYVPGDLDGGEPSAWFYGNQWSYAGPNHGIPTEDAREAARGFVRTGGQRPTSVEWVEDDS